MNQNQSSKKNLFIILIIIVVALVALFYFMGNQNSNSNSLLTSQSNGTSQAGDHVLALLNQIQSLEIDTSIFTSLAFQSLQDYSVNVPPLQVGRPNPFAPLPGVKVQSTQRK